MRHQPAELEASLNIHAALVDTHAHLDFDDYDADRGDVIDRAWQAGVRAIVTVGIEPALWPKTLDIARRYWCIYAAIGIHPNSADRTNDDSLALLEEHCRGPAGPTILAIGETGLDYYREHVPHDVQRESFRAHLDLARRLDLPVIVHNRDAHDDVLAILRSHGEGTRGVMHSFSGDPCAGPEEALKFALECIKLGYLISLAGPVTFRKATDKHAIARDVPLDSLLVETDCPFLTPEPFRGRRNEPAYVAYTARAIAELRGTTYEEVAAATTANATRLFCLPQETGNTATSDVRPASPSSAPMEHTCD